MSLAAKKGGPKNGPKKQKEAIKTNCCVFYDAGPIHINVLFAHTEYIRITRCQRNSFIPQIFLVGMLLSKITGIYKKRKTLEMRHNMLGQET